MSEKEKGTNAEAPKKVNPAVIAALREERERLVRIANVRGAGVALAAVGFVRCKAVHAETSQRCLLGSGHRHRCAEDGYAMHESESVTWLVEEQAR